MQVTEMKVGDLFPRPRLRLQADGVGLNLSDALSIIARVKLPGSSSSVEREVIVSDQDVTSNHGIITIVLLSGDTDYKGIIKFDVEVEWVTGVQTWPSKGYFKIWVLEDADSDQGGGVPSASQNDSLTFGRIYDVSITDPEDGQFISYDEELNRWVNKANNLSDLTDAAAARTALGLGTAATANTGTGAGTVAAGDDSRFSDARTPTDGSVSTVKIVDGAVTDAKLASKKAPRTALWLPGVSGNYASAPYVAAMGITGDLEVTAHAAPTDWTPAAWLTFAGRYISSADQRCWRFTLETNGKIALEWSTNGTSAATVTAISSTAPTVTNGDDLWVRATLDVDNGAGGYEVKFYTSSDGTTWTQLGTTVTGGSTTSVFSSASAALEVGGSINGTYGLFAGDLYSVEVRNGIGGTVVASPDFTAPMGPRLRDAQGNIFTINGSAWAWEYV